MWLPESPRYLHSESHTDEEDLVMSALKGLPVEDEAFQVERAKILAVIALEDYFGEYNLKLIFYNKSGQKIPFGIILVSIQMV